jgi:hypothetical protein
MVHRPLPGENRLLRPATSTAKAMLRRRIAQDRAGVHRAIGGRACPGAGGGCKDTQLWFLGRSEIARTPGAGRPLTTCCVCCCAQGRNQPEDVLMSV